MDTVTPRIKKLLSISLVYGVGSVLEKSVAFLLLPLYTLYLNPKEYGIIALLMMILSLLQVLVLTPPQAGLNRYYYAPEWKGREGVLFLNASLCVVAMSGALALLVYSTRSWIAASIIGDPHTEDLVALYAVCMLFKPVGNYTLNFLWLRQKAKLFVTVSLLRFLSSVSLIVLLMAKWHLGVYAVGIGELVLGIFPIIALSRFAVQSMQWTVSFPTVSAILRYGFPLILNGLSNNLIQWSDRYLLRLFMTVSAVGLYTFAYNFSAILNFTLVMPSKQALQPFVFQLEQTPDAQRDFISKCCTYFLLAGMGIWLPFSIFSEWGIRLMANDEMFYQGWRVVPILSFCYMLHGLGNFFAWGIIMKKNSWHLSWISALAAVTNIGLNIFLIPLWGIFGAALATLICYLLWDALKLYYSYKQYALKFNLKRLFHIILIALFLYFLSLSIHFPNYFVLSVMTKIGICLAYPIILYWSGFFRDKEIGSLFHIIKSLASRS